MTMHHSEESPPETCIIAVNGLTRGGTNLISSLLQAQEGVVCGDVGVFELPNMMQSVSTSDFHSMIIDDDLGGIENNFNEYIDKTVISSSRILIPTLLQYQEKYRINSTHYCGISVADWIDYHTKFYNAESIKDFELYYQSFAQKHNIKALATRVTGCTPYIKFFLESYSNHYWIEVVRDPLARFYSAKRGHSILPEYSFKQSRWQLDLLDTVNNNNLIVISYEELVSETYRVIDNILSRIGICNDEVKLVPLTPDEVPFYGNSSSSKTIFSQDTKHKHHIYTSSISSYKGKITAYEAYVAKYYGFGGKLSPISKIPYLCINIIHGAISYLATFFVFLSLNIKLVSIAIATSKYIGHSGYSLDKVFRRSYSNLYKKYSKFKF